MKVVKIGAQYSVSCFDGEKVSGHKPSVDVLFNSMADSVKTEPHRHNTNRHGPRRRCGICRMRQNGAYTIGQNKESCVVYGMPMVAYEMGGVCTQASCENIANILMQKLRSMK